MRSTVPTIIRKPRNPTMLAATCRHLRRASRRSAAMGGQLAQLYFVKTFIREVYGKLTACPTLVSESTLLRAARQVAARRRQTHQSSMPVARQRFVDCQRVVQSLAAQERFRARQETIDDSLLFNNARLQTRLQDLG